MTWHCVYSPSSMPANLVSFACLPTGALPVLQSAVFVSLHILPLSSRLRNTLSKFALATVSLWCVLTKSLSDSPSNSKSAYEFLHSHSLAVYCKCSDTMRAGMKVMVWKGFDILRPREVCKRLLCKKCFVRYLWMRVLWVLNSVKKFVLFISVWLLALTASRRGFYCAVQ